MKSLPIITLALLLVGCATNTPSHATLTADRAGVVARRLANERAHTLYDCRPFGDVQPARFVEGHWVWHERRAHGVGDLEANVELAADGSPRHVEVLFLDSRTIAVRLYRR